MAGFAVSAEVLTETADKLSKIKHDLDQQLSKLKFDGDPGRKDAADVTAAIFGNAARIVTALAKTLSDDSGKLKQAGKTYLDSDQEAADALRKVGLA